MSKLTRRCVIPVPAGAKPGHTLTVQTDAGLFQLAVPAKIARLFVADLPVPEGCALPHLTVAWVRVGGADAPDAPCEKPTRSFHADHALDRGEDEDAADDGHAEASAAPLRVCVHGIRTNSQAVTEYCVKVYRELSRGVQRPLGEHWHRYSAFSQLHDRLGVFPGAFPVDKKRWVHTDQVHEHREAQLNQYMARLLARYEALAAKQRLYATADAPGTATYEADELPAALRVFLGVEGDEAKLAEDAVEAKPPDGMRAKERAAEALDTARVALETAPEDAAAHIWYGQAVGTHAKVFDPGLGQGRVCNVLVQHWDRAVELAPQDPLPYHLLGSFAFHTSALPWATQSIVRALSPGLRKFTADDAMELLRQSEARMPSPPCHFAVTNRSMLGRLHLRKGQKVEARVWLDKALELLAPGTALDRSGQEAADEARKARAKL